MLERRSASCSPSAAGQQVAAVAQAHRHQSRHRNRPPRGRRFRRRARRRPARALRRRRRRPGRGHDHAGHQADHQTGCVAAGRLYASNMRATARSTPPSRRPVSDRFLQGHFARQVRGPVLVQSAGLPPLQQGRDGPGQADGGSHPSRRRLLAHLCLGRRRPVRRPHLRSPVVRQGPWKAPSSRPTSPSSCSTCSTSRSSASTTPTSPPRARRSPRATRTSAPSPTSSPRRCRVSAPSCSGARPTSSPTAATWRAPRPIPIPMCSPMPPAR